MRRKTLRSKETAWGISCSARSAEIGIRAEYSSRYSALPIGWRGVPLRIAPRQIGSGPVGGAPGAEPPRDSEGVGGHEGDDLAAGCTQPLVPRPRRPQPRAEFEDLEREPLAGRTAEGLTTGVDDDHLERELY